MSEMIWKVAFATGSRADYGIVRRYLRLLHDDPRISLSILVTGALLEESYGSQVSHIEEDGFHIGCRIPLGIDTSSDTSIVHSMARALDGFSSHFSDERCDLLIVLGDRYEMLSVATAAAMQRIPILHIHGGEATFASYDEFIRHSITKMSLYHFVSTEKYRRRVVQLGEDPHRVFNLGALGAENCGFIEDSAVPSDVKDLPEKGYFVVLFHPETLSGADVATQVFQLLEACDLFSDSRFVFLGSNADTHSEVVRSMIQSYVAQNRNSIYFENLGSSAYHFLLKHSICLIGNSSSGLIEAPSLGIPTVNIGDRQAGRVRGSSVLDVSCERDAIAVAMKRASSMANVDASQNPYYQPHCAERYFKTTMELLEAGASTVAKRFYDII